MSKKVWVLIAVIISACLIGWLVPVLAKRLEVENVLSEFSIPLIFGVLMALICANMPWHWLPGWWPWQGFNYTEFVNHTFGAFLEPSLAHYTSLHFLVNEIFMVAFFGIAAVEIKESTLPGGVLNPIRKALNPLLGTLGGVFGPIGTYFLLVWITGRDDLARGWGIPTATDIALAWLVAKMVFGPKHPAVSFLLLLAVADDGIGLGIIAVFYPDPGHPVELVYMLLAVLAILIALGMKRSGVKSWVPFLAPGMLSWWGFFLAHLHPALAMVPIVFCLPGPDEDEGLFAQGQGHQPSVLGDFGAALKTPVDFGLFAFAFTNAGVAFSNVGTGSWIVLISLLVGKPLGITMFSSLGASFGLPLPRGMEMKHLFVAGVVAGIGLTVALFVAGQAFTGLPQEQAKMGALFSGAGAILAIGLGWLLKIEKIFEGETKEKQLPFKILRDFSSQLYGPQKGTKRFRPTSRSRIGKGQGGKSKASHFRWEDREKRRADILQEIEDNKRKFQEELERMSSLEEELGELDEDDDNSPDPEGGEV